MFLKRLIAVSVLISSFGILSAESQTLRDASGPAEFPPESFTGKQFVDSKGCAYVRAGIDGAVTWVPRVTRARKLYCGLQPTFPQGATRVAEAPARTAEQIEPEPATQTAAAKQAPAAKPAAKAAAQAKPKTKPQPRVAQAPKPKAKPRPNPVRRKTVVASATPKKQAKPVKPKAVKRKTSATTETKRVVRRTSCPGYSGVSARYAGTGPDVRCGPQKSESMTITREPVKVVRNGQTKVVQKRVVRQVRVVKRDPKTGRINAPANARIVPRHVYEKNRASQVRQKTPEGYRNAWDDDRLNTRRAEMSPEGIRQSDLVWTRTVPRKLYLRETGRVVNHLFPDLRYPYTSMRDQNTAMGFTTSTRSKPKAAVQRETPRKTATASGAKRYVQVGMFGVPANAQRAAQRVQAAGLPARMGRLSRGGKTYKLVLAGPFAPNQLRAALGKARRAGFSDAFLR
ncbi:SPOR domain-containing protein [Rhodobacteraceae bacterium 63075]|nr:SPOR domain-containing protein [Rhodobacteraceae bacterium 63075]